MAQVKSQRNASVRNRRNQLKLEDPARYENMKEKEKLRGRKRRLAKVGSSPPVSVIPAKTLIAQLPLPSLYNTRKDLDDDLEMFTTEEAKSNWRRRLPADYLELKLIGAGVGMYVNNNNTRFRRKLGDDRKAAFDAEKALADPLLRDIDNTLYCARSVLQALPYSTMMLETPQHAISELSRWTAIYAEAIEAQSHLTSRMEAASSSLYWHPIT